MCDFYFDSIIVFTSGKQDRRSVQPVLLTRSASPVYQESKLFKLDNKQYVRNALDAILEAAAILNSKTNFEYRKQFPLYPYF